MIEQDILIIQLTIQDMMLVETTKFQLFSELSSDRMKTNITLKWVEFLQFWPVFSFDDRMFKRIIHPIVFLADDNLYGFWEIENLIFIVTL